jgi:glycogen phosphorylase
LVHLLVDWFVRGALTTALSLSVRDRLIERWKDTQTYFMEKDCKRVAYLSMEFLLGRALQNAIINIGLQANFKKAMMNLGQNLEEIYDIVCAGRFNDIDLHYRSAIDSFC